MSSRTRLGLGLLWVAALVAALIALGLWRGSPLVGGRRWMAPTLIVFSALVVWRDSAWLVALDLFALVVALTLGALRTPRPLHRAGLADYAVGLGYAGAAMGGRTVALMKEDIEWRELPKGPQARQAVAVGRGLMLAAPLLFLFGALFVAADSVFQGYVSNAVPNPRELTTHVVLVAAFAWVSAGLLREYLVRPQPVSVDVQSPFSLGATEVAVVLGL